MIKAFFIRLRLILKLWFTSLYSGLTILLIPIIAIIFSNSGTYQINELSSVIYEKTATIWFVFIIQWCFSIDFDSKFYDHLITYPVSKWKFVIERVLFSIIIFIGWLVIITIPLGFLFDQSLWQGFFFTIPVYLAIAGCVILGTVISNHSIGGLLAGIFFWMLILFGGALLQSFTAILLTNGSVDSVVGGQNGLFAAENRWILFNRLFYCGVSLLFTIKAILVLKQQSV